MFIIQKLIFYWIESKSNLRYYRTQFVDWLARKWLFDNQPPAVFLLKSHFLARTQKQEVINQLKPDQFVVFYAFRDTHLLDWFVPIHRALDKEYPGKFAVFYINFGSTLKKVGNGTRYLAHHQKADERLFRHGISSHLHFSSLEIESFSGFPHPDVLLTSETIRKESFSARQRIYLPHYTVPKAGETFPLNIRYNHIFLPTRSPFSYKELAPEKTAGIQRHEVGYPKMYSGIQKTRVTEAIGKPRVVYAPSLNVEIIFDALKDGLLEVFKGMPQVEFIIKLHPTVSSKMQYIRHYINRSIALTPHIINDSTSNIQDFGASSNLMIADFGSVGAEYRLSFGKRIIYLKVPQFLEGGADLNFRDRFADAICGVPDLLTEIPRLLAMGDLTPSEKEEMGKTVLYSCGSADITAARAIFEIASKS